MQRSTHSSTTSLRRFARLLLAKLLAVGPVLTYPHAAWTEDLSRMLPRFPSRPTEVVIIGTRHSAQLEYEEHAPARIRALLNRIDPAAVGVETSPRWYREGVYFEIAYESYGVAVPWAEEKGKEVRPVDWQARGWDSVNALSWPDVTPPARLDEEAEPPEEPEPSSAIPLEAWDMRPLLFADTPEWRDAVNREYAYSGPRASPAGEALRRYMLYRNVMIAREIVNLAADHEGERIVVLIGAAHKPDLELLLAPIPNIVLRNATEWAEGISVAEVDAEERRRDHLAILWYNLAGARVNPEDVDLPRMERILARLEAETPGDPELRFLRARWYELGGRPAEALAIDTALAWEEEWADRPFTYPDRSLAERLHAFEAREWLELAGLPSREMGVGSVVSPVSYLTIRQRVLYEIAEQSVDPAAAARAREELLNASGLNPTQVRQVASLLASAGE